MTMRCYLCPDLCYITMDFRKRKTSEVSITLGRVYTMDAWKVKCKSDLIAGMCYIHGQPLFVLFDCGVSYSFISTKFVIKLGLEKVQLPSPMTLTTSHDDSMKTT